MTLKSEWMKQGFIDEPVSEGTDLKKEITDGVQTFNYQVNSMTNTNG